jgi:2-enoate reductase
VILAVGLKPEQKLFDSLKGTIPDIYLIGDAKQPRNIMSAIWDAYEVARDI